MALRVFVAGPADVTCVEAAPGVEEAYDLLVSRGVPAQRAADMATAAARAGRDPVVTARHFLQLRDLARVP
jgi:hypothetical protein